MKSKMAQSGFSMIEVMITAAVLVVGILGIAKLQISTLGFLSNTNQHYLAASLAHDMGERIRANYQSVASYIDKDTNAVTDCSSLSSCNLQEQDMWLWSNALKDDSQALPAAVGSIIRNGDNLLVTISWNEKGVLRDSSAQSYALEVAYQ